MRILKPGDPCPCCGQPVPEGTPVKDMYSVSVCPVRADAVGGPARPEPAEITPEPEWKAHLRRRFERTEGEA